MTPEQFAAFMSVLETVDRRLAHIEKDLGDQTAMGEAAAEATEAMSRSLGKLQELYIELDRKSDELADTMSNYVQATMALRNESRQLHSLVREKLKAG